MYLKLWLNLISLLVITTTQCRISVKKLERLILGKYHYATFSTRALILGHHVMGKQTSQAIFELS